MTFAGQNPAELLHQIERIVDISAHDLARVHPTLEWVLSHFANWKFFLKVAAVGMASLPHRDDPGFLDKVDQQLEAWDSDAKPAIKNFLGFMSNRGGSGSTGDIPAWVGFWVLWNVKQTKDAPTLQEARAAPKVGEFCARVASSWDQAPR